MGAIPYVDLAKSGINRPSDLIQFPWDVEPVTEEDIPTDDEVEDMMEYIKQQAQE